MWGGRGLAHWMVEFAEVMQVETVKQETIPWSDNKAFQKLPEGNVVEISGKQAEALEGLARKLPGCQPHGVLLNSTEAG